ncbi:MAG: DUF1499 domain-containing protein [Cycloclasticus sp.]|nr:DUF1499 domain-containing protein [Cycloclasticus sp.]MBQ0789099.1 DUF1499 domain-containing protein [Cycloclasticus sp.]
MLISTIGFATNGDLKPCPDKPNCVSSTATNQHAIEPFHLTNSIEMKKIAALLTTLDTHVSVMHDPHRIHAEITSRVFGFVDDLDLLLLTEKRLIHVRSASRTGHYDFGVNRRRVEKLRILLKNQGLIQ